MEPAERTYRIIRAKDGSYAVQITPDEEDVPLTISGFKSEIEALAWIEAEQTELQNPTAQAHQRRIVSFF